MQAHMMNDSTKQSVPPADRQADIAEFRENISSSLLKSGRALPASNSSQDNVHFLRETEEREQGKRSDGRKRRYCVGCYDTLAEERVRVFAKMKAVATNNCKNKKVILHCTTLTFWRCAAE